MTNSPTSISLGSFPLDGGAFKVELSPSGSGSQPSTPPRHHRTPSPHDGASSSNCDASNSLSGLLAGLDAGLGEPSAAAWGSLHCRSSDGGSNSIAGSSSLPGSRSSSAGTSDANSSGGARSLPQQQPQQQLCSGQTDVVTRAQELPDFPCMLPSECCFCESSVDEAAAAPRPHMPVVSSMFEGQGLEVSSACKGLQQERDDMRLIATRDQVQFV